MKLKLTLSMLFLSLWVRPCGWEPDDNFYYYNVFAQTTIDDPDLYPFLNDEYHTFFSAENVDMQKPYHGNFLLWQKILPHWTIEELKQVLNKSSNEEFDHLWKTVGNTKDTAARKYMETARACADTFAYRRSPSWEYDEILRTREVDVTPLLQKTMDGFENASNQQLKARYAYQILRIFHYSKQYDEAIAFFNQKVKDKFPPNEIYYYCMDQVAGCYYSKNNFDKSAYLFLQVFDKSTDRKKSAAQSYRFCDINGADAKQILKTGNDSIAWYTLHAWRGYNSFESFKKACAIDPSSPKTELLFMRTLNRWEQARWPTGSGIKGTSIPTTYEDVFGHIDQLAEIADSLYAVSRIHNRDFWLISASYLDFMAGNRTDAMRKLVAVKAKRFDTQKDILAKVYTVFGWEEISNAEAAYCASHLKDVFAVSVLYRWAEVTPAWKYLIIARIAHLYYDSGKLAEAFLCQNHLTGLEQIASEKLITDLQHFYEKENKTELERMLAKRSKRSPGEALAYIYEAKGLYYLQNTNPQKALPYFEKSDRMRKREQNFRKSQTETGISARIFSNNTMECFHCDEARVMTDSVFLADVFGFIKPHFDKTGLTRNLLKLDSLTKSQTEWKAKLANYLLGNYYFNVSNTGYFRGTLTNRSNCCDYSYVSYSDSQKETASLLIDSGEGFNLYGVLDYPTTYFGLADKAYYNYYQNVLDKSSDPELNARTLYMMAKCELNSAYNNDGMGTRQNSFSELNSEYKQTDFYQQIIKECSFFRYYVSRN